MKLAGWQQLDLLARRLWPLILTLGLVVLGAVPLQVPYYSPIGPAFALVSVYYWAIHRPSILPAPAVFLVGLVGDFLGDAPLGVGGFVLLTTYGLVLSQRRLFLAAPFVAVWFGFAAAAAGATLAGWMLSSLLFATVIDPRPALFGLLLTFGLYPAIAHLFARAQRGLLRRA